EAPLAPGARIEGKRRAPQVFPQAAAFHADPRADARHKRSAARCVGATPDAEASARRCRQRQDDRSRDRLPRRSGRRLAGGGDGSDRDPLGAALPQIWRMAHTSRPEDRLAVWGIDEKRSEEHTSELQSLAYLVCRLLLEKKKKKKKKNINKITKKKEPITCKT